VTIGRGKGENWWCVVFPPLCASVTEEEFTQAARQAGLSDNEISFITGDGNETVVIRFKTLEILDKLFNWR
jgi:stage II sporulation protein R